MSVRATPPTARSGPSDRPGRPLRVCHVSTLTRRGGVESRLLEYLAAARGGAIEHRVIATSACDALAAEVRALGVPLYQPPRRVRYDPRAIPGMACWLRRERVDVVHTRNRVSNCWGGLAAALARVPARVAGEHGTVFAPGLALPALERRLALRGGGWIANSDASLRALVRRFELDPSRVRVIHDGVGEPPAGAASDARHRLGLPADAFIVGSIARLDTPKDPETFVRVAAAVRRVRPSALFVLVGGGPLESEVRALDARLGAGVRFAGWRPDAASLVRAFDLFLCTSLSETLGNALIEAAHCEVPAVAPRVGGVAEVVRHDETGILLRPTAPVRDPRVTGAAGLPHEVLVDGRFVPPRALDAGKTAEIVVSLLDDPERRKRLGAAARAAVRERFALDRYVRELEAAYRELWRSACDASSS